MNEWEWKKESDYWKRQVGRKNEEKKEKNIWWSKRSQEIIQKKEKIR